MTQIKVDIIILSKTSSLDIYKMNLNCINSLLNSEKDILFNIILVESEKSSSYIYPNTKVIKPSSKFGYNKFLLIGLEHTSSGDYIAFCNNDLLFSRSWMTNIINKNMYDVMSYSPIDITWPWMKKIYNKKVPFEIGYNISEHIAGWCIIIKRELLNKVTNLIDPDFDFYYADNDYSLTLRKNSIKHAIITDSHVTHLQAKSSSNVNHRNYLLDLDENKIKYPYYLKFKKYNWITHNYKYLDGYMKFYKKWGGMYSIMLKIKVLDILNFLNVPWLTKIIYTTKFKY